MAGIAPGVAVALYQLADEIEIAGERNDHDVVAALSRPDKRFLGCDGCDPDWRIRLLHRPGHQADGAKPVKFPPIKNPLLRPKPGDDVNAFFETRSALFHAQAGDVGLPWSE